MKNIIYLILILILNFGHSYVEAQSLMDRVNKVKTESAKPSTSNTSSNYSKPAASSSKSATTRTSTANFVTSKTYVHLRNRWKGTCIHNEFGYVDDTKLGSLDWASALWSFTPAPGVPSHYIIMNKGCLLYTSPSPRD